MDYENTYLTAYSESAQSAVFDEKGYVALSGDKSAKYLMSITANEDYPTIWSSVTVAGAASAATLTMTDEGYVLTADDLNDISVYADNKYINAQTTFSSGANSVLIYEINESTIGIREDSNGDGTFDRELSTGTKALTGCDLKLSSRSFVYDGSEKKPEVSVTDNGTVLREGTDYTVSYQNAKGEGAARVRISGIGGYSGTLTESYYIEDGVKLGDVNGDQAVTAADRALLTRYIAKWKEAEIADPTAADVNLDGSINALDRIILTRHVARKPAYTTLPV